MPTWNFENSRISRRHFRDTYFVRLVTVFGPEKYLHDDCTSLRATETGLTILDDEPEKRTRSGRSGCTFSEPRESKQAKYVNISSPLPLTARRTIIKHVRRVLIEQPTYQKQKRHTF